MRDAPVPDDVAELRIGFVTGSRYWTVRYWLLMPDLDGQTTEWASYFFQQLGLDVAGPHLSVMHAGVSLGTCRLTAQGITYVDIPPARGGSYAGGQANGVVLTIQWVTEDPRATHRAITHLSGVPDSFVDLNTQLSPVGIARMTTAISEIWRGLQLLPTPLGSSATPVTLRRRANGQALPAAIVDPIIGGKLGPAVSTMRRRMPKPGSFPPYV